MNVEGDTESRARAHLCCNQNCAQRDRCPLRGEGDDPDAVFWLAVAGLVVLAALVAGWLAW